MSSDNSIVACPIPTNPLFMDLSGKRFGHLEVLAYAGRPKPSMHLWWCKCDCGKTKQFHGQALRDFASTSCGCANFRRIQPKIELTGKQFGRWTVMEFVGSVGGRRVWRCKCECGSCGDIDGWQLRSGGSLSCGCLSRERAAEAATIHGWTKHPVYFVWHEMISRCHNENSKGYKDYGSRGIRVCDRWRQSVVNFIDDMGLPPTEDHSIDRRNNDGNYEPSNCRWATQLQQNRNKRSNVLVTIDGEARCVAEWAERFGVPAKTAQARIRRGWMLIAAVTTPVGSRRTEAIQLEECF